MHGFYRVAAAIPEIRVADVDFNVESIKKLIVQADDDKAAMVVFPELTITGYTCADLFFQSTLLEQALEAVEEIAKFAADRKSVIILGAPMLWNSRLYNCAFVCQAGKIIGVVPKTYLPNYREFYEKRWFCSGKDIPGSVDIEINGKAVPFGTGLLFERDQFFKLGIEVCEDLWYVIPPSSHQALAGATISVNLSASDELVAKADYRRSLIAQQSARCVAAYVYSSAGVHESTTDVLFSGHAVIAENGAILAENDRFQRKNEILYGDIDCQRILGTRIAESTYSDENSTDIRTFNVIKLGELNQVKKIKRFYPARPFVPEASGQRDKRCREIFQIQTSALAKRLEHTKAKKAVIGLSGGLDSTLALLVVAESFRLLNLKMSDILTVTMPGFGTTNRTKDNAKTLAKQLGVELREINIGAACEQHFKDIGHDPGIHDITYENTQARERTQILMDLANQERGLVIGTGDLSEIALGWCTYNGDHISMYSVNCGVPKTLIKYLVQWVAESSPRRLKAILMDILDTPISPELLPNDDKSEINQKTEELIGPYDLHDFFLYHSIKYGAPPEKLASLAKIAFGKRFTSKEIKNHLKIFLQRFFSSQFKRSCVPDGPKVGTIALSPRGDWRMPSDAAAQLWLKKI